MPSLSASPDQTTHEVRPTCRDKAVPEPSLGTRLRRFVQAEILGAASQLARSGDDRHPGVHLARKHLRRVRAVLALGRSVLGKSGRRLDEELGQMCRGLSSLRDAQALIEGLERLAKAEAGEPAAWLEAVRLALQRRDLQLQAALARDPDFQRRRKRLQDLARRLDRLAWDAVDEHAVAKGVQRSERRLDRALRRAHRVPGDEERWHALRRRFRRLRQQDKVLEQEWPDLRPDRAVSADDAAALGEAQDDALLLRRCGRHSPFPPELRKPLRRLARERLGKARKQALPNSP